MAHITMDHRVSGCFGTQLAPLSPAARATLSAERGCVKLVIRFQLEIRQDEAYESRGVCRLGGGRTTI